MYMPFLQADWLHRFESCHDYLVHLSAQELRHIVIGITLSQRSLKVCLHVSYSSGQKKIPGPFQLYRRRTFLRCIQNGARTYRERYASVFTYTVGILLLTVLIFYRFVISYIQFKRRGTCTVYALPYAIVHHSIEVPS